VTRRTITIHVGWLVLAGIIAAVVIAFRLLSPDPVIDPADVREVCAAYAALDLSRLAPLCVAAGYQQTVDAAPAAWPTVTRDGVIMQPEDLDRAG
jgi:hypothetical protein